MTTAVRDVRFLGVFTDDEHLHQHIARLERQVSALAVENARLRGSVVTDRHTSKLKLPGRSR